jgi:hypothetical protein
MVKDRAATRGLLALLLPLMRRTMHEREQRNLRKVKAILEGGRS